jgi:hypothetical protein
MKITYYELSEIFRARALIELPHNSELFNYYCHSIGSVRLEDLLNILPVLMYIIIKRKEWQSIRYLGDIILCNISFMNNPSEGQILVEFMKPAEIQFFYNWLVAVRDMDFARLAEDEYNSAFIFWGNAVNGLRGQVGMNRGPR